MISLKRNRKTGEFVDATGITSQEWRIYKPNQNKDFNISRSRFEAFKKCQRCFYIDRRLGVGQPPGFPFNIGITKPELISGDNPLGRDPEDPNGKDDFLYTELVLAKDKECIVTVSSKDVIHNLALHPMRMAQDAIPGSIADMWFKPIKTGRWETVCGQLCGAGHSGMVGYMEVKTQEEFDAWYKENTPSMNQDKPLEDSAAKEKPNS